MLNRFARAGVTAVLAMAGAAAAVPAPILWRHGVINLKSDAGFVMMPMQHDFAAKRGMRIEAVQVKDGALALKALISGEVDSIEGGAGEGIIAAMRGADVKTVGCHWPGLPHALFVRGNIDKIEGLKGKTIATSAPGSLPDNMMRALLGNYGISASAVRFTAIGSDADRYRALTAGIVDATVVSSEYLPIAPPGIKILIAGRDVIPDYMRLCLNVSGKTIAARRADAVKFLAIESEGISYAVTHRDETIRLAQELSGAKPDDPRPAFVYDETVKYRAIDPDLPLPMRKLEWMQAEFVKTGALPRAGDLHAIIEPTLRQEALDLVRTRR